METEEQTGRNRGKSSEDTGLFSPPKQQENLRQALHDMHFLLSRGYPVKSALALAGNRYRLKSRQLLALQGMACSEAEIQNRSNKQLTPEALQGTTPYLDGFNILIVLETLLSGGYVFKGLDGCYRDISSVHGTYRKVNQTEKVLVMVGNILKNLKTQKVVWIFDTPVSNSGKVKTLCYALAATHGFNWEIYLENNPDKYLAENNRTVCSADAWVLNECNSSFNLGAHIINLLYPDAKPDTVLEPDIEKL